MNARVLVILAVVLAIAALGIHRLSRSATERATLTALADSVRTLRSAADGCSAELRDAEAELAHYRARLDSMHSHVRSFETIGPDAVPAARYEEYLQEFDRYQDSTGTWQARVDTLQLLLAHCRELAEAHNEVVDTLRLRRAPN
jgi:hypothetical protein